MKRRVLLVSVLILVMSWPAFALTGRKIMEKSDELAEPDTAMSKMIMRIHKGGRMEEKAFTLMMKQYDADKDKALLEFIRPTKIKLLTHSHGGREDDQWLRLSSGRIKRVAASSKGKPFVNSHFYYEDLTSVNIDDYKYKSLGEGQAVETACYKVEGIKKDPDTRVYEKLVFYVRQSDYFISRIDFYMDGQLHKYLENYDVKKINSILTPHRATMYRADGKGKTELFLGGVKYNVEIPDIRFKKEALR